MTKPSKRQIADAKTALREIHAEVLGWEPHILVLFDGEPQKARITARMKQLGWRLVDDPSNETADIRMMEFSLDGVSHATTASSRQRRAPRIKLPAPFFATFSVLWAVVGFVFTIVVIHTDHRMKLLDKVGTVATGEVERSYSESGRGGRAYYVSYRFVDMHGLPHENDDSYPFQEWKSLHPGDPISVTYLAYDPQKNDLTLQLQFIVGRGLKDEITVIGTPWILAGAFFVGYLIRGRPSSREGVSDKIRPDQSAGSPKRARIK